MFWACVSPMSQSTYVKDKKNGQKYICIYSFCTTKFLLKMKEREVLSVLTWESGPEEACLAQSLTL